MTLRKAMRVLHALRDAGAGGLQAGAIAQVFLQAHDAYVGVGAAGSQQGGDELAVAMRELAAQLEAQIAKDPNSDDNLVVYADWLQEQGLQSLPEFFTALAIGLLIGLERERRKGQGATRESAGLRTFMVAALLAYALSPLVNGLERLTAGRLPRLLSVALVELAFLLVMAALVLLVVPVLVKELPQLREQLPTVVQRLDAALSPWLLNYGIELKLDAASVMAFVFKHFSGSWEDMLDSLLSSLRIGGSVALTVLGNLILIPVALFYLLLDWKRLVRRATELVPHRLRASYDGFMAGHRVVVPGTPVVTLADLNHIWLRAYVAETDLGRIRCLSLGQRCLGRLNRRRGGPFPGHPIIIIRSQMHP